jgi:hypothetical protein
MAWKRAVVGSTAFRFPHRPVFAAIQTPAAQQQGEYLLKGHAHQVP